MSYFNSTNTRTSNRFANWYSALVLPTSDVWKIWLARVVGGFVCLVPLTWFSGNTVIAGVDFSDPFNPGLAISQIFRGWTWSNLGQLSFRSTTLLFPYDTFWWVFREVNLSIADTQRLWFVSIFLLGYLSALYLFGVITVDAKTNSLAGPVLAIVFLINPFTLSQWSSGHDIGMLSYYAAPLFLATLYKLVTTDRLAFGRCFAVAIVSLLFAPAFIDLSAVSNVVLPSLLMLILVVLLGKCSILETFRRVGCSLVLAALLNIWWLGPLVVNSGRGIQYAGSNQSLLTWPNFAVSVPFLAFLRGGGFWGYYAGYQGIPYYRYSSYLHSLLPQIAGVIIVLLVPLALIFFWRTIWAWFVLLLYLIGVDLASALNGPLWVLNRWIFWHVPGMFVFRSTHEKFEGLVLLAVLISGSILASKGLRPNITRVLSLLLIVCTLIGVAPMVNGEFRSPRLASSSIDLHIPNSYRLLLKWTSVHKSKWPGEMLVLPQLGYISTIWGLTGGDILPEFSKIPTLVGSPGQSASDGPSFAATIEAADHFTNRSVLDALGIDLVLVRSDIKTSYYPGTPNSASLNASLVNAGFPVVARFGYFTIYSVSNTANEAMAFSSIDSVQRLNNELPVPVRATPMVPGSVSGLGVGKLCNPVVTSISAESKTVGFRCLGQRVSHDVSGIASRLQGFNLLKSPDNCGGAPPIGMRSFAGVGAGDPTGAVVLESSGGHACVITGINGISNDAVIRLSFSYKWISGSAPRFVLLEPRTNTYLADVTLQKSHKWKTATYYVQMTPGSNQLSAFFYADAATGSHTVESYANLGLASVTLARSLDAVANKSLPPSIRLHVADIKLGPTSVIGNIERVHGSVWLTLPYSSDANWHLSVSSPNRGVSVLRHEVIDGFLTAWQIRGSGNIGFIATANAPWIEPLLILMSVVVLIAGGAIYLVVKRRERVG
jgi:hypothetical protein